MKWNFCYSVRFICQQAAISLVEATKAELEDPIPPLVAINIRFAVTKHFGIPFQTSGKKTSLHTLLTDTQEKYFAWKNRDGIL